MLLKNMEFCTNVRFVTCSVKTFLLVVFCPKAPLSHWMLVETTVRASVI